MKQNIYLFTSPHLYISINKKIMKGWNLFETASVTGSTKESGITYVEKICKILIWKKERGYTFQKWRGGGGQETAKALKTFPVF